MVCFFFFNDTATTEIYTLSLHDALPIFPRRVPVENFKTLKTWLWVFSATKNLRNVKLHHMDNGPNMRLWDDFRQNLRPKIFSEKIAIFTSRVPVENVKTLKTWLWVFSAIDNLRNVKLHHIDYGPNMSLWDDFRQNRRPKVFTEKIAIFPRRGPGKKCKTLKTWLWVFSATNNLRNVKLHHIDNGPNMSLWDDFRQYLRLKIFSEKIAIFTRRVPVENIKTLKTWLWVFSATDYLKNLKLHHIDCDPNMSLWDDFRQNRRPKVFREKIAIFPRRWPGNTCKTLKTWLWVFSAIDNLKYVKLHHINYVPKMSLWDNFRQNRRPKVFREKIAIFTRRVPVENVKTLKTWLWVFSAIDNLKNVKLHHIDYDPNKSLWDDFSQNRRAEFFGKK